METDLKQLAALLTPHDDGEYFSQRVERLEPGGECRVVMKTGDQVTPVSENPRRDRDPSAIWSSDEVVGANETLPSEDDPRPQPEYTMNFRQSVTPEDVFLQMGNKNASTASCEELVVRVSLPGESMSSTAADVQPRHLDVRAASWRLLLHLPHPVRSLDARAQWDSDAEQLVLVLPLSRELEALNF